MIEWDYTGNLISDNPYDIRSSVFHDQMYDMGYMSIEKTDSGFEYFLFDLSGVPLSIRIEHYELEINRIAHDVLIEEEMGELEEFYDNCKMLMRHKITLISDRHCKS